jgi:hypothetical protein
MTVVRILLDNGAQVEAEFVTGFPFDVADEAGYFDIASLLLAHSKKKYFPVSDLHWLGNYPAKLSTVWDTEMPSRG